MLTSPFASQLILAWVRETTGQAVTTNGESPTLAPGSGGRTVGILGLAGATVGIRIGVDNGSANVKGTASRMERPLRFVRVGREQGDGPVSARG